MIRSSIYADDLAAAPADATADFAAWTVVVAEVGRHIFANYFGLLHGVSVSGVWQLRGE